MEFSLLANLGAIYRETGHYSRAIEAWEAAWALGRGQTDYAAQALANHVAAELATLLSSLGRTERLRSLLAETTGRNVYGSAGVRLMGTKENLWMMDNKPGESFKCGPYALGSIRRFTDKNKPLDPLIRDTQSTLSGFALTQVRDLSNSLKMNYQMAKRSSGAPIIIPSVVHWKSGHYAALLQKRGDVYLTQDPTFGRPIFLSEQALEDESSGYFLIPNGDLPQGWVTVSDAEGGTVFGRGQPTQRDDQSTKTDDKKTNCPRPDSKRMAVYDMFAMIVSLTIEDTPVGYTPPVGPDMNLVVTYNQAEAHQSPNFELFNFGPSWNCSWLSYVTPPASSTDPAYVNTRGGGRETYDAGSVTPVTIPGYVGYYGRQQQNQNSLWITSDTPARYERRFPDGSKEVFGQAGPGGLRLLSAIIDPQGNAATLQYDSHYRLITVTDALGLQTHLYYELASNPIVTPVQKDYLVTKVTDPYSRSATFDYPVPGVSAPYQLKTITDPVGIQSVFTYGTGSVITSMTTPYGTTSFTASTGDSNVQARSLLVTHPENGQEYAESNLGSSNYPYSSNPEPVPITADFNGTLGSQYIGYRNTYFWNKKAMQATNNQPTTDYSKAYIYHFLHTYDGKTEANILESEKPALENRIWYVYPSQPSTIQLGPSGLPIETLRVMSDQTVQTTYCEYGNAANPAVVTAVVDPLGRRTEYVYDPTNGIDLQSVTQKTGTNSADTLLSIAYDGSYPLHCPKTVTDAANQTTNYTYNPQGQVTSITPPTRAGHGAETTNYDYTQNFLTTIRKPFSGATIQIIPDIINGKTINRPFSITDPELYTLKYMYDNLDHVTKIIYPDSSTEVFDYIDHTTNVTYLDVLDSYDRLNRKTHREYDAGRRLKSITDPLQQTTRYDWCACGALEDIVDPRGNTTTFMRDLESRVTSKIYPVANQQRRHTDYVYDTATSRVHTKTDARGNVSTYSYNLDDTVSGVTYAVANGTALTASDSYTYDQFYKRLHSANGVPNITYIPALMMGAGKRWTVTGTLAGGTATIKYGYDEWGRVNSRSIDNFNTPTDVSGESITYDSIGRPTNVFNNLGSFDYLYFDPTHPTNRLGRINLPNGQVTTFNYFGNDHDERLEEIKYAKSSGAIISQHNYTYDAVGRIRTWQRQTDNNSPLLWTIGYDDADQLKSAVETNIAIPLPSIMQWLYSYDANGNNWDPSGNSPSEQIGTVTRSNTFNNLNQLTGSSVIGDQTVRFTGSLNGASGVTVNGNAAATNGASFSGSATIPPGNTSTVTVIASNPHGDRRTDKYQTAVPALPNYTPIYDLDGNETTDGAGQTYSWNAKHQLVMVSYATGGQTTFSYNGLRQRIGIVETGAASSNKQLIWDGSRIAEERDAGNNVTKRFYSQGEQITGLSYFYARDHLGSVSEMLDSSQIIRARYAYDPYGVRSANLVSGDSTAADFGFTGHYFHQSSGLHLTYYRAYQAQLGRWMSRDPIGELGGTNLYDYVVNDPVNSIDAIGLSPTLLAPLVESAPVVLENPEFAESPFMWPLYGLAGGLVIGNIIADLIPDPAPLPPCPPSSGKKHDRYDKKTEDSPAHEQYKDISERQRTQRQDGDKHSIYETEKSRRSADQELREIAREYSTSKPSNEP